MVDDQLDDFLREVSAERTLLTEQEKKEAMIAAW